MVRDRDKDYTARIELVKELVDVVRSDLVAHRAEMNRMFERQNETITALIAEVRNEAIKAAHRSSAALARTKAHELVAGVIVTLIGIGLAIWGLLK
jgi:hypothetical protein